MDVQFYPPRQSMERGAASIEFVYGIGHWLLGQGRYAECADVFRMMLMVAPADERAWLALGECHERLNQPRIALELFSTGTVAAAPAPRCMLARARVLRALGDDDAALQAIAMAAELAESTGDDELAAVIRAERRTS